MKPFALCLVYPNTWPTATNAFHNENVRIDILCIMSEHYLYMCNTTTTWNTATKMRHIGQNVLIMLLVCRCGSRRVGGVIFGFPVNKRVSRRFGAVGLCHENTIEAGPQMPGLRAADAQERARPKRPAALAVRHLQGDDDRHHQVTEPRVHTACLPGLAARSRTPAAAGMRRAYLPTMQRMVLGPRTAHPPPMAWCTTWSWPMAPT